MKKLFFTLIVMSALLLACTSTEKSSSEQATATTAKSKNYYTINGKAVRLLPNTVPGADELFQFFNTETNDVIPFPKDVVGYQQMGNSETRFNTAISTSKGFRFKYVSEASDYPPCLQIRERFYSEVGPLTRVEVILCKNEASRWIPLEMINTKTGNKIVVNNLPPSETEEAAIGVAGAYYEKKKLDGFTADSTDKCMNLYIGEREACFLNVAGDPLFNYLLSQENPNIDTLTTTLTTMWIPPSTKTLLEKKLLALTMKGPYTNSYSVSVALQNPNLTQNERSTLIIKYAELYTAEVEAAKNSLRKCMNANLTWKSIKERGCARQLGGEEWLAWLEKDFNAPSKDIERAIADAKKIGRSTAKLEENYKHVLRSEADQAHYADKYKREQEEKAAFGNLAKIMEQARNGYTALCAKLPQNCSPENFKSNLTWKGLSFDQKQRLEESQQFLRDYVKRNP